MSVRAGREFLAIPGPTTAPDEVLRAMRRPTLGIPLGRGGAQAAIDRLSDQVKA